MNSITRYMIVKVADDGENNEMIYHADGEFKKWSHLKWSRGLDDDKDTPLLFRMERAARDVLENLPYKTAIRCAIRTVTISAA